VVVAGVWAADYRSAERAQCRSSNETRTAVIDASSTAVLVASMEFADDEAERVEARRIAGVTAEALAARPGLRLRDC
jgi:hypothetical protein